MLLRARKSLSEVECEFNMIGLCPALCLLCFQYQTAANSFTEDSFTEPHRESTESLLKSVLEVVTNGIADGRNLSPDNVSSVFDVAVMTAPEAASLNIIDRCAYRDELPGIFREKLREGVLARRAQSLQAEREWQSSMSALASAWAEEDGAEFARWRDGANIAAIDSLMNALRFAAVFGNPRKDDVRSRRVAEAEVRALKAHLAWLDTRPWEAIARKERSNFDLLFGMGHSSSIVELERRLCTEGIRALESFPGDIAALNKLAKANDGVVNAGELKKVIRWTRGVWRAKAFAARMVGSMATAPDEKNELESTGDKHLAAQDSSGSQIPCSPRLFLLHQEGDLSISSASKEVDGKVCMDYCELGKDATSFKDRLRYQSFNDYVQLVSTEQRAGMQRSGSFRRISDQDDLVSLKGMPETEYIGGVVDMNEKAQLSALADHKKPILQPWRLQSRQRAPTVAVINVDGAISDETSEDTRASIRRASKDPRIQGIVMRIDSPGMLNSILS